MSKLLFENEILYRIYDGISASGFMNINDQDSIENAGCLFIINEKELESGAGKLNKMILDLNNFLKIESGNLIPVYLKTGQRGKYSEWIKIYKAGLYVFFGLSPDNIGLQINVNAYQIHTFLDHKLLFVHPLHDFLADSNLKKQFWKVIKDEIA
jgi:hypothetical protein